MSPIRALILGICLLTIKMAPAAAPVELQPWLQMKQDWGRDTDGPIVSLGARGQFDDTHIFAPGVARLDDQWMLWYAGSTAEVAKRVFHLGLSTSPDGRAFSNHPRNPVFSFGNGKQSVLTPVPLRDTSGEVQRENGKIRMWFTSTWFEGGKGKHTLHETSSIDGVMWSEPTAALMEGVYAPTILKVGKLYQMWYTDVSGSPWIIRHAWSRDGRKWYVTAEPSVFLDQDWERQNLFYPFVIKVGDACLMWYGSYWKKGGRSQGYTALGFAVSNDGMIWHKHPNNPVFKPDPDRPWESNYVTSHSVAFDEQERSFRIWYASRKKPPFINKYFAINTAVWNGVPKIDHAQQTATHPKVGSQSFAKWQSKARDSLHEMLGIPQKREALNPVPRGEIRHGDIRIEKWVFTSEKGSRVPALLYLPATPKARKLPAVVFTYGHGGSKSAWQYHYAGQLYANLGMACLAIDPIGEEERHVKARMGTRAHDPRSVHLRADKAGRLIMGKLVFDTMRAIDFLETRDDIDHERIGIAGNSLGGAKASWMTAVDPRIKLALICGWTLENIGIRTKYCTKAPNQRMREMISWSDFLALGDPNCATLIMNGDADVVIDREGDRSGWTGMDKAVAALNSDRVQTWYEKDGGHRPFFAHRDAIHWIEKHLDIPGLNQQDIAALPTLNGGQYCDANGIRLERLYGTDLHQRGATIIDLGINPLPRETLAVLRPEEIGLDDFTIEGWLKVIER